MLRSGLFTRSCSLVQFVWHPQAQLSTSLTRPKGNARRPRSAAAATGSRGQEKTIARRDTARQLLANTNRKKWEEAKTRETDLAHRLPETNVYLAANFTVRKFSLADAVESLREAAHPDMFDCMENPLRGKDADEATLALSEGACQAGGEELIGRLEHGAFHWEEYDTVVAHLDLEGSVGKVRNVLKDRMPSVKNGRIGEDLLGLLSTFSNSMDMQSTALEGVPEVNYLDVIIGQLSWDVDKLHTNLQAYFDAVEQQKSTRILGQIISAVEVYCPPTGERFLLDCTTYTVSKKDVEQLESPKVISPTPILPQTSTSIHPEISI